MWTGVSSLFEYTEPFRGKKHHSLGLPRIKVKAVFSATLLSGLPLSDIFLRILVCSLPIISPITRNIYMSFSSQAYLLQPFVLDPRCHRGGPMKGRLRLWHAVFLYLLVGIHTGLLNTTPVRWLGTQHSTGPTFLLCRTILFLFGILKKRLVRLLWWRV